MMAFQICLFLSVMITTVLFWSLYFSLQRSKCLFHIKRTEGSDYFLCFELYFIILLNILKQFLFCVMLIQS